MITKPGKFARKKDRKERKNKMKRLCAKTSKCNKLSWLRQNMVYSSKKGHSSMKAPIRGHDVIPKANFCPISGKDRSTKYYKNF